MATARFLLSSGTFLLGSHSRAFSYLPAGPWVETEGVNPNYGMGGEYDARQTSSLAAQSLHETMAKNRSCVWIDHHSIPRPRVRYQIDPRQAGRHVSVRTRGIWCIRSPEHPTRGVDTHEIPIGRSPFIRLKQYNTGLVPPIRYYLLRLPAIRQSLPSEPQTASFKRSQFSSPHQSKEVLHVAAQGGSGTPAEKLAAGILSMSSTCQAMPG